MLSENQWFVCRLCCTIKSIFIFLRFISLRDYHDIVVATMWIWHFAVSNGALTLQYTFSLYSRLPFSPVKFSCIVCDVQFWNIKKPFTCSPCTTGTIRIFQQINENNNAIKMEIYRVGSSGGNTLDEFKCNFCFYYSRNATIQFWIFANERWIEDISVS